MKNINNSKFIALVCLLALAQTASAFGDKGHEIIAALAYPQLTEKTKAAVDQLLELDKDQLTAPDFISRATWADKYRDSDRNTTKIRYSATRNWHFVDLDLENPIFKSVCSLRNNLGLGRLAIQGETDDCIVDKLEQFRAELKNPAIPQSEKIYALKFILHFVGDIHQPLHASTHNDHGGNHVTVRFTKLKTRRSNTTNLHSYWDNQTIENLGEISSLVVFALRLEISKADKKNWSNIDIREWALESNHLAKESVYEFKGLKRFRDKEGNTAYVLSASYQYKATEITAMQLKKAGVRLAAILNDAFDQSQLID